MKTGRGAKYKGKSLDEIEFSDSVESDDSNSDIELNLTNPKVYSKMISANTAAAIGTSSEQSTSNNSCSNDNENINTYDSKTKCKETKNKKNRWTNEQKNIMLKYFKENVKKKIAPKKDDVEKFLAKHSSFKGKSWVIIKAFIYNSYRMKNNSLN